MEWLLVGAIVGAGAFAVRRWRSHRVDLVSDLLRLDAVQRLAREDVTVFGQQLQRLSREIEGLQLEETTRLDQQTALDAYGHAQHLVARMDGLDQVGEISDALDGGRYALACVQARIADRPLPERRVPCLFNAQHGPSVTDVVWTAPGRGARLVPVCAQDAARIARSETPEVRQVKIHGRQVPFWEAGDVYGAYNPDFKPFITAFRSI